MLYVGGNYATRSELNKKRECEIKEGDMKGKTARSSNSLDQISKRLGDKKIA